jgi:hypothetical protein
MPGMLLRISVVFGQAAQVFGTHTILLGSLEGKVCRKGKTYSVCMTNEQKVNMISEIS